MSRLGKLYWYARSRAAILFGKKQGVRAQADDFAVAIPLNYQPQPQAEIESTLAVVCHLFHIDLAPVIFSKLQNIRRPTDLYISTDTEAKRSLIHSLATTWSKGMITVRVVTNRGRDIAPKLVEFADIYERYDLVLFLHSKRDTNAVDGTAWRNYLLDTLLGSPAAVDSILEIFRSNPQVGIIAPQHIPSLRPWINWGDTFEIAETVAKRMNFKVLPHKTIDFPSGSMFWARTTAIQPMLDLRLATADFAEEEAQFGGTIAHALERLFFFCAEKAGYSWLKIGDPGVTGKKTTKRIGSCTALTKFVRRRQFYLLRLHQNKV